MASSETAEQLYLLLERRWVLAHTTGSEAQVALANLDREIETRYQRVVASFVLDMSGFTRLTMRHGILHYLSMIRQMVGLARPLLTAHQGRIVKQEADNLFVLFPQVTEAVEAALELHRKLEQTNLEAEANFEIFLSIGIGYGPTLDLGNDLWGADFNLASKLGEDIAEKSEVMLTEGAYLALHAEGQRERFNFKPLPICFGELDFNAYKLEHAHNLPKRTTRKM